MKLFHAEDGGMVMFVSNAWKQDASATPATTHDPRHTIWNEETRW